jgi:hypothetical protein
MLNRADHLRVKEGTVAGQTEPIETISAQLDEDRAFAVKVEQAEPVMNPSSRSFILAIVSLAVLAVLLLALGLLVAPRCQVGKSAPCEIPPPRHLPQSKTTD